jgi:hypothetical protein
MVPISSCTFAFAVFELCVELLFEDVCAASAVPPPTNMNAALKMRILEIFIHLPLAERGSVLFYKYIVTRYTTPDRQDRACDK